MPSTDLSAARFRQAPLPPGGAWRVHPQPQALPRVGYDGGDEGGSRNRYDDPLDVYRIRYTAERLTGALVETLARFRPSASAEALLAAVEDGAAGEGEGSHPDPRQAVADWLISQHVGRLTLVEPTPVIDIHDAALLSCSTNIPWYALP